MKLTAENISYRYSKKSPWVLKNISFTVEEGERVGIVAPSGYGKTTFAKILAGYETPVLGRVLLDGNDLPKKGFSPVQLICQHPEKGINPSWNMSQVLEESSIQKCSIQECNIPTRDEVMKALGIEPKWLTRRKRELSGGELQRFCVARALCSDSKFLIADEISAMLDGITQAQIWNYLLDQAVKRNMGMIVITHNIELAKRVCTRIEQEFV